MKLLLVSDLHYSLKQFDWVADMAGQFDLVVIAGDHLDISGVLDGQTQAAVVMKYFRDIRSRTNVVVCSGNHDLDSLNGDGEKFAHWILKARRLGISVDGDSLIVGTTRITVCPWWDGPHTRVDVGAQLERDAAHRGSPWIWVYHAPPDESPTSVSGRRHFGDVDLNAWIGTYQPDIVLTGHIHESPFHPEGSWVDRLGSTWVFNAGRQIGPVPTHVVVDTTDEKAFWFSMEGAETVELNRDLTRPLTALEELPSWYGQNLN